MTGAIRRRPDDMEGILRTRDDPKCWGARSYLPSNSSKRSVESANAVAKLIDQDKVIAIIGSTAAPTPWPEATLPRRPASR